MNTNPINPFTPHPWFAWFPVRTRYGGWVWLRIVKRIRRRGDILDMEWWDYLEIQK